MLYYEGFNWDLEPYNSPRPVQLYVVIYKTCAFAVKADRCFLFNAEVSQNLIL